MSHNRSSRFDKIFKEPLLHFLLGGFCLFIWFEKCQVDSDDYSIEIRQQDLMNLMQYRSKAFDKNRFEQQYQQLGKSEKQALIDEFVEEEVLYREAKQLGLDQNDYVIKRRMMQKMDFLYAEEQTTLQIPEDSLKAFYQNNPNKYLQASNYTFTHIFQSNKSTNTNLEQLKGQNISFENAGKHGERFLYQRNYVARDFDFIEQHFGLAFAEKVKELKPDISVWQGPFESLHGQHLILLTAIKKEQIAPFESVKEAVRSDCEQQWKSAQRKQKLQSVIDKYEVKIIED